MINRKIKVESTSITNINVNRELDKKSISTQQKKLNNVKKQSYISFEEKYETVNNTNNVSTNIPEIKQSTLSV